MQLFIACLTSFVVSVVINIVTRSWMRQDISDWIKGKRAL